MTDKPFWVVWCPASEKPITCKHPKRGGAQYAAKLMAKKTGLPVYVLKAQSVHEANAPDRNKLLVPWGHFAGPSTEAEVHGGTA